MSAEKSKTRVQGYVRVSSDQQSEEGVSLAAQRARLEQFCLLYDLELIGVIEDAGFSGKSLQRPGLQSALSALTEDRADGLLVAKMDRLTRSVRDLGLLLDGYFKQDYALLSVGEQLDTRSAAGRLVLYILAVVSAWEVDACAERTRAALAHLRTEGVRLGGEAIGWRRTGERDADGRLVVEELPEERAIVDRIVELRAEGASLREIARILENDGVPTKRGGRWSHRTVAAVIRRGGE